MYTNLSEWPKKAFDEALDLLVYYCIQSPHTLYATRTVKLNKHLIFHLMPDIQSSHSIK